ncbi:hypothetical protein QFC19_004168 [Naganishia cerealis]|uniref:Uncharacterized protein n=1 Tax=Naganishia cerealis TaxID=610337 RepID=A0ACC2VX41_9TREE|nr:hypothetical protein QFC19_004168 [Naganishia cerealis]
MYQLVTLYIGYLSFPAPNATSQGFPVDPLLPPNQSWGTHELHTAAAKEVIFENQDDEESQIANVRKQEAGARVQTSSIRRARSDNRDDSILQEQEENEYNVYSEEDDLLERTDPDGDVSDGIYRSHRPSSLEGPYTVVHIPILFMLRTILTYPRPSSVSSLEPPTTAEPIPQAGSESTSTTTDVTRDPQRSRRTSAADDLRIQALTGLNPGMLNTAAHEHAGGNNSAEQDDSRAEYRRMPGGYSRPSL